MAMNTRIFQMPFADVYPLYLQKGFDEKAVLHYAIPLVNRPL